MSIEQTISWICLMAPLIFSPGPTSIIFAVLASRFGWRKAIPFVFGTHIVSIITTLLIGIGVLSMSKENILKIEYLKYIGGLYICFIAYKVYKSYNENIEIKKHHTTRIIDGILFQLLNGKAYSAIALMFVLYIEPGSTSNQLFLLTIMFFLLTIIATIFWILCGEIFNTRVNSIINPKWQKYLFTGMLVFTAFYLFIQ